MITKETIIELRNEFVKTQSKEKREEIMQRIDELSESNPQEFAEAAEDMAKAVVLAMDREKLKKRLEPILEIVPYSYIAKKYFHKSASWFAQRLNGSMHNGKRESFNSAEIALLDSAIKDIANKIDSVDLLD